MFSCCVCWIIRLMIIVAVVSFQKTKQWVLFTQNAESVVLLIVWLQARNTLLLFHNIYNSNSMKSYETKS